MLPLPRCARARVHTCAQSSWIPKFNDKPVTPDRVEAIQQALPAAPIVEPKASRRALVYSATAGFRHDSIPTGKLALEQMGRSSGAYEAVISDAPANFEAEVIRGFDAVVLLSPTQDFFMPNKKQKAKFSDAEWSWLQERHDRLVANLIAYVEQGGGLVGIHAASDSCYGHEAYGEMIGGYFAGHPWNGSTKATIVVEDPEHATIKPVFEGMDDFKLVEEMYQYADEPYSRENLRILLHLDPARSDAAKGMCRADNDSAVAWVQSVGKGRVFYTSI
ncbi:MAG: ThuA domain-containing protein [Opitutales bacterium]